MVTIELLPCCDFVSLYHIQLMLVLLMSAFYACCFLHCRPIWILDIIINLITFAFRCWAFSLSPSLPQVFSRRTVEKHPLDHRKSAVGSIRRTDKSAKINRRAATMNITQIGMLWLQNLSISRVHLGELWCCCYEIWNSVYDQAGKPERERVNETLQRSSLG